MGAEYPGKVTTQLKSAINNLSLTLTDDVGENVDEIFVVATAGAPASGSFHIENEIIFYPEKTSIKFGPGLTRGADGTTKAVHLKTLLGGEVIFGPEAHFINNLNDELIATQTKLGITGAFNFVAKTGAETIAGVKTLSDTPKMDAIAEKTSATGVTIDGILLKDDLDTSGIVGKTLTQTLTNKTLTSPVINTPTGDVATKTGTETLTNKRITKREVTITSSATPTPDSGITDIYTITALAEAATFGAPTGTPTQGQGLIIRIKDNATARALSFNAIYRASSDLALPTTTVISKTMYLGFIYNSTDTKWDFLAFLNNI